MKKYDTNKKTGTRINTKVLLSTLWIFAVLNYIYCDVISFMDSDIVNQLLTGTVDNVILTNELLFFSEILM